MYTYIDKCLISDLYTLLCILVPVFLLLLVQLSFLVERVTTFALAS
jgi:hypothetical protein